MKQKVWDVDVVDFGDGGEKEKVNKEWVGRAL